MAFFDQIKDMAKAAAIKSEEFAKTVGKKAEAAMEMQKLASDMEKKERFIKDNYMQMGMEVYQKAAEGEPTPEYLLEYCKLIDTTLLEIDELQNKIDLIKQEQFGSSPAKVPCPHCGEEVPAASKFCPECGGALKQENTAAAKEASEQEAEKQEEAVTDADKSAETIVEEEKCSEPDAAANAKAEQSEDAQMAAAQPEQVKNITEVGAKGAAASEEVKLGDAAFADNAAKEAEVIDAVKPKEKADILQEEITDAEIVETDAKAEVVQKPEPQK